MKKIVNGNVDVRYYINPGQELSDIELLKFRKELNEVSQLNGKNIQNKIYDKNLSLEDVKKNFWNNITSIVYLDNFPVAFMVSPIFKLKNNTWLVHSGLLVIGKNPGINLMAMLSAGNATYAYKNYGNVFVSNISSTPAVVEYFSQFVSNCWPHPNANLKRAPKKYREVILELKSLYLDKFFPQSEKIYIDTRKFVMSSKSNDMGFDCDFYNLSRPRNLKYLQFCQTWLNYQKEEDMIQIGRLGLFEFAKMYLVFKLIKWHFQYFFKDNGVQTDNIKTCVSDENLYESKAS